MNACIRQGLMLTSATFMVGAIFYVEDVFFGIVHAIDLSHHFKFILIALISSMLIPFIISVIRPLAYFKLLRASAHYVAFSWVISWLLRTQPWNLIPHTSDGAKWIIALFEIGVVAPANIIGFLLFGNGAQSLNPVTLELFYLLFASLLAYGLVTASSLSAIWLRDFALHSLLKKTSHATAS